jgi:hypothetical protein
MTSFDPQKEPLAKAASLEQERDFSEDELFEIGLLHTKGSAVTLPFPINIHGVTISYLPDRNAYHVHADSKLRTQSFDYVVSGDALSMWFARVFSDFQSKGKYRMPDGSNSEFA